MFKNAMNYFANTGISENDPFVNQIVDINGLKLKVKRKICEGGFAIIYQVEDIQEGNQYALKRLIGTDKESCNNIINEINIHKKVSGHPNIVTFVGATFIDRTKQGGRAEYLLVTELCSSGSLFDCIEQTFEPDTVLKIFYQATKAVAHLHAQSINHRDIKIENFLIGSDGLLKLCDFGSATQEYHAPDITWTTQQRNTLEDMLQRFTTPMYRAPEQLDTWANYPIGCKTDIWALGCILAVLCFKKHPFEDSAKLRIINGNYTIPNDSRYICFHDVIRGCLQVDPNQRFDTSMILERLGAISETKGWSLKGSLNIKINTPPSESPLTTPAPTPPLASRAQAQPPPQRPAEPKRPSEPPRFNNQMMGSPNPGNVGLFSSIKGGAGSFLKNLKDTSSKVMQTVQQSIGRTDLDISYITQRIIVASCPSEGMESTYKSNNIEDVKMYLESRHLPAKISVYNFGPRTCPRLPPPVRTVESGFIYQPNPPKAPILNGMYSLAEDMYGFLNADTKNIIIIQGNDQAACATMMAALLIYANLVTEPEDAMQIFAVKRLPPNLRPSEIRYLYYLSDICRTSPHLPHYKPITLVSVNMCPVPRMTKARDGVRLFLEVTCNDKIIISTLQDYERMRLYHASEGKVNLPLNVTLCGDITISIYHARNTIAGMGRPQGIKVCQLQFHSGFIPEEETLLNFKRAELDDIPNEQHVPAAFNIGLSVFVSDSERPPATSPPWLPNKAKRDSKILFATLLEYEENVDNFITKPVSKSSAIENNNKSNQNHPQRPPPPRPAPPVVVPAASEPILSDEVEPMIEESRVVEEEHQNVDLLNLNEGHFDFLGGIENKSRNPIPDLLGSTLKTSSGSSGNLDDIFGPISSEKETNQMHQSKSSTDLNGLNFDAFSTAMPANKIPTNNNFSNANNSKAFGGMSAPPKPQPPQKPPQDPKDPFADLNPNWGMHLNSKTTPTSNYSQYSSPVHQFANTSTSATASPITPSTPSHQQAKSPSEPSKPDYSRTHFVDPNPPNNNQKTKPADIFGDILGQQGYLFGNKGNQGPRTINDMRKEEMVKDMDPERFKVLEWTEGKKGNIRALLCSVHTVLWSDAKWNKCEMSTLVSANDVKKAYRRACLAVHPDKHAGTDNENIAKLIFMELNNAWSAFENDDQQQNLFAG